MKKFIKFYIVVSLITGISQAFYMGMERMVAQSSHNKFTAADWGVAAVNSGMIAAVEPLQIYFDAEGLEAYITPLGVKKLLPHLLQDDGVEVGVVVARETTLNSMSNGAVALIAHELGHAAQVARRGVIAALMELRVRYNLLWVPFINQSGIINASTIIPLWFIIIILLSKRASKLLKNVSAAIYMVAWVVCLCTEADASIWAITHVWPEMKVESAVVLFSAFMTYASLAFGPVMAYVAIRNK